MLDYGYGVNDMSTEEQLCENYVSAINCSFEKKVAFLMKSEILELFHFLPINIGETLKDSFIYSKSLKDSEAGKEVIKFFREKSKIIPALAEYPGTYTMLEKMYHFEKVCFPIDFYFLRSIPGGQALRQRYLSVNNKAREVIKEILLFQESCLMIDIGSGPGRNSIDICRETPGFVDRVIFENIDIDEEALRLGQRLATQRGLSNIFFLRQNMTSLKNRYPQTVDVGLLIGILCGLKHRERVILLRKIRPYFRKGGKLIAAGLTNNMLVADLFCSYILYETADWNLQYQPFGQIKSAFEEAGWEYESCFSESRFLLYEIGIGIAG